MSKVAIGLGENESQIDFLLIEMKQVFLRNEKYSMKVM